MAIRKSLALLLAGAAVPVAILAWWLGSPLFLDRSVDESFPLTTTAAIPDNMTRREVEQVMAAMAKLDAEVAEPMPERAEPVVLKRGQFEDADTFHRGSGRATVYRLANGEQVLRFDEFRVTNGPDLRVLMSRHAAPTSRSHLETEGYVELGRLKGNVGSQNYPIPDDVSIDEQHSVVIYCKPFHVIFSVAPLANVHD